MYIAWKHSSRVIHTELDWTFAKELECWMGAKWFLLMGEPKLRVAEGHLLRRVTADWMIVVQKGKARWAGKAEAKWMSWGLEAEMTFHVRPLAPILNGSSAERTRAIVGTREKGIRGRSWWGQGPSCGVQSQASPLATSHKTDIHFLGRWLEDGEEDAQSHPTLSTVQQELWEFWAPFYPLYPFGTSVAPHMKWQE